MKIKRLAFLLAPVWVSIVAMAILLGSFTDVRAQSEEPAHMAQIQASMGSAFTFQGRLIYKGNPADGNFDLQFALYDAATAGSQVGSTLSKTSVAVGDGVFAVPLDFGASAFYGQARYLEIAVRPAGGSAAYTVLSPRQALMPVPYALYSAGAPWNGLAGIPGAFADGTDDDTTYAAGAGLTLAGGKFSVNTTSIQKRVTGACPAGQSIRQINADGTVVCESASSSVAHNHLGETWTGHNNSLRIGGSYDHPDLRAPLMLSNTAAGDFSAAMLVEHSMADGITVAEAQYSGIRVQQAYDGVRVDHASVGVRVKEADEGLLVEKADGVGVYVEDAAYGVAVFNAEHAGFNTTKTGGAGVLVQDAGTHGVEIIKSSSNGVEIWDAGGDGVYVKLANNDGLHVKSAQDYGVKIDSSGADGLFVGSAGDDGVQINAAVNNGVYIGSAHDGLLVDTAAFNGVHVMTASQGLYVENALVEGVRIDNADTTGLYVGQAAYGVHVISATEYAGYFGGAVGVEGPLGVGNHVDIQGDLSVAGSLTKASGSFMIDHPLDPERKYLQHSFVESPEMRNLYDGNVTLDDLGEAWVELPIWFEELNEGFCYQLTPIGSPAPDLHIAEQIKDNRFRIAGGTAGMMVSWQVTGTRRDPYARAHPLRVEMEKLPEEQGLYLHPQEWGQSAEKGIGFQRQLELDHGMRMDENAFFGNAERGGP